MNSIIVWVTQLCWDAIVLLAFASNLPRKNCLIFNYEHMQIFIIFGGYKLAPTSQIYHQRERVMKLQTFSAYGQQTVNIWIYLWLMNSYDSWPKTVLKCTHSNVRFEYSLQQVAPVTCYSNLFKNINLCREGEIWTERQKKKTDLLG